jgi:uncharacterized surface protein with fasciclin (FAS1) repeats
MRRLFLLPLLLFGACTAEDNADPPQQRPAGAAMEAGDAVAAIRRLPEFSVLTTALESTGVAAELAEAPTVTLLATRDTGFAELPPRTVPALLQPAYEPSLRAALRSMALPRLLRADELRAAIDAAGGSLNLPSLGGSTLVFSRDGDQLYVTAPNGARASMGNADIGAGNGAIYVLDGWLGPVPPPLPEQIAAQE